MGFNDGPNHDKVRHAIEFVISRIKAKGMEVTSFAVTPAQAVEAMRLGVNNLFLGFDPMYIQASLQLFLSTVSDLNIAR
jgi:2-keto-3-deoxy-L-rhamnonate aldolase RhmA